MKSLILSTATRLMTPLILAFSLFMLLRGHDQPGGGFIGGLLAATAFCLFAKAEGVGPARAALRAPPLALAMVGVGVSLLAGIWGLVVKGDFLQAVWPFIEIAADGSKSGLPVGSVLMFDVGVYLAVVGAVTGLFLALEADAAALDRRDALRAEARADRAAVRRAGGSADDMFSAGGSPNLVGTAGVPAAAAGDGRTGLNSGAPTMER